MNAGWAILTSAGGEQGPGGDVHALTRICRAAREAGQDVPILDLSPDEHLRAFRWSGRPGRFVPWRGPLAPHSVLYNRVPGRIRERRILEAQPSALRGMLLANPHFLDKDQFALRLTAQPSPGGWRVPYTTVVASADDVAVLLSDLPAVYLKPIAGHAGAGIVRCERVAQGAQIETQSAAGRVSRLVLPLAQARKWLRTRMRGARYIAQAEAPTLRWCGRRWDLRVLVQRRPGGAWGVTGAGARVGAPGAIVTHVPNGGTIAPVASALTAAFGAQAGRVWDQACESAVEVAARVSEGARDWCEFTVDMGFGDDGAAYVFEANAKPMRFDERPIERLAKARVVEYLTWVAENRQTETVVSVE